MRQHWDSPKFFGTLGGIIVDNNDTNWGKIASEDVSALGFYRSIIVPTMTQIEENCVNNVSA